jgi:hypothetical protein
MSEIDSFIHECLGIVNCPSDHAIVPGNNRHRNIPLYRLDEDALENEPGSTWRGKQGDLLLGGGSGESAALRISIPEAIYFVTDAQWDAFDNHDEIYHAYWSANEAYIFCNGYAKSGWTSDESIELWLIEHIIAFILREYPSAYTGYVGSLPITKDGSICRLPTSEEKRIW